ncbi:UDP-N-acetylmuramoyl-L-alanyl-D-glutamate--2,6-diaminopimelate ligase [Candidatus Saccharibacteria bacterium oral taxon 488]|nr:UDP-N-acetylmuramoyl-L-alanyl-D-glutamate--2,6-diaminopimelate ligase [Candidatus Saccharibacteria bacterium oral taxon 488]
MKAMLVKFVRKVLPGGMLRRLENGYRRLRVKLVSARYGNPSKHLRVIAVTGTNGKTTTSCYINEILKEAHFTTAMFTTAVIEVAGKRKLNDLNATVASTARMQRFFRDAKRANVDYVVLEVTSHALDQHKLDGVPIEAAVMTNLTQDHLDYHKTMEEYAAAKSKLFQLRPRFIVLNRDDEWYDYFNQFVASEQKMTYGRSVEAEAKITHVKLYRKGTEADVVLDHQTHLELATNLPGEFNVMNMTAATTLAYLLGVKLEDIQEGVANVEAVPGRFERAVEGLGYDVIVDYAHTPDALEKLLAAARGITKQRVILVFGACGDRDQGKRPIMGEIAARGADRIFLTDEESYNEDPEQIRRMLMEGIERGRGDAKTTEIADRRQAIERALGCARKGDMVLITGMGHEQYRIVNGQRLPWNDGQVVREIVGQEWAA